MWRLFRVMFVAKEAKGPSISIFLISNTFLLSFGYNILVVIEFLCMAFSNPIVQL